MSFLEGRGAQAARLFEEGGRSKRRKPKTRGGPARRKPRRRPARRRQARKRR